MEMVKPEKGRPSIQAVIVTPEMAKKWLSQNLEGNRRISDTLVQKYKRDMQAGVWQLNGEMIRFDEFDNLIDGQHRLAACVEAGVPFTTYVMYGLEAQAFVTIDTGRSRNLADHLHLLGYKSTPQLSAAIRVSLAWESGRKVWAWPMSTVAECLEWLNRNPGIENSMLVGERFRKSPTYIPGSVTTAFHYRVNRTMPEQAEAFFDQLGRGVGYQEGSPLLAYRNVLGYIHDSPGSRPARDHLAYMIKAFNFWLTGRPARVIIWRPGGAGAEDFPKLIDRTKE